VRQLDASTGQLQWVVDAYTITNQPHSVDAAAIAPVLTEFFRGVTTRSR
jgi:hypothetical protein